MYDNEVAYIMQGKNVILLIEDNTYTINTDHPNYTQIVEAIKDEEFDGIVDLIDIPKQIQAYGRGKVEVVGGEVLYAGECINSVLNNRIITMMREGFDIEPMIAFLENLMLNPSKRAVDELYLFLETNSLPITRDGHFLAYKNVGKDYKDIYSKKFDNSVGSLCEMPRNQVDDERDRTCSKGLHFCSLEYLKSYPGDHTMILKINPADVVSIPSDYNNTKGRCCKYLVVGEHAPVDNTARYEEDAFTKSVVSDYDKYDDYYYDYGEHDEYFQPEKVTKVIVKALYGDGGVVRTFDSVEDAADWAGVEPSYIRRVLRGERKTTGGYGWETEVR